MPIFYSVVSRGPTILAKYASCEGNYAVVTEHIIGKIPPDSDRLTYSHGSFLFHYVRENGIIYLCITDDEFERSRAFLFLHEIMRRFQSSYGLKAGTAIAYSMNNDFSLVLANEMKHFSEARDLDTISRVHGQLDEVKNIMVKNIDSLAERGEKMELLVNKTEHLSQSSITFRKTSRNLAHAMFWKSVKLYIIIGCVGVVITYFVVSMACGGLTWKNCV